MLQIRLLGTASYQLENQPLSQLATGKAAALLIYLAVTGQPQSRALLTDLLWTDTSEQQAKSNLRYLLSNLRKAVGDYVLAQGENIVFNQDLPYWLDVTAFTTYLGNAATPTAPAIEPEILQELLNLYTGEFLTGFQTEGMPVFERWMMAQRRNLHDLLVQGLRLRTQQHLDQGQYDEGLAINHYLLTLEPWREEAHRQRMLLFAYSGQRSAALQQFALCSQILAEELDVSPMQQTTTLYEQIKSGQWFSSQQATSHTYATPVAILPFAQEMPGLHRIGTTNSTNGATGATPLNKPQPKPNVSHIDLGSMPDTAHFYGRQAELACLHSWAGQEQSRLIALLGGIGQGKSALAATFAQEVFDDTHAPAHTFTQVIWRSLQGAPSCVETVQEWLRQLEDDSAESQSLPLNQLITRLFACLQARRCLLVLDGVEAILADPPQTADGQFADRQMEVYRPGCEGYAMLFRLFYQRRHRSCLLLTSRIRFDALSHLEERAGAFRCLELEGLSVDDTEAMLSAQRIRGGSEIHQQLHQHYAGNPLLLNQAANLTYELFAGDMAAFLQEGLFFLGNIGIALRLQLADLSSLERRIMQQLAQSGHPFYRQTLYEQLSPSVPKHSYFQALQSLQRRFLIQQIDAQIQLSPMLVSYLKEHPLDLL